MDRWRRGGCSTLCNTLASFFLQFCRIHLSLASLAFCATYFTFLSGVFVVYALGVIRLNSSSVHRLKFVLQTKPIL